MGQTPFPRNERCPCGSGDKYKRCCFTKGFHYYVVEVTGEVLRSVPLDKETRTELEGVLAKQREKFIAKFGREPGPTTPSSSTSMKKGCDETPSPRCTPRGFDLR